ncbi:MAG: class I SAM-dependent methyltransferase [Anaerolineaceae bacterium]|nr:class I SAM-dependent methyltransferase [Anaerolineaceae bacterium]
MPQKKTNKEFLELNINSLPYFRGLLRAVEAQVYQEYDLPHPIYDLGCGDGHFESITFDEIIDVGLDPWAAPLKEAVITNGYDLVIQGNGDRVPFSNGVFKSAFSNSVLEHIPDVDAVLKETNRILEMDAPFLFCVPNHQFLRNLSISNFLDRIGLKKMADVYRELFNKISRHHHCDSPETWKKRLDESGFEIVDYWHYFSPRAFHLLEWGHYFGLPALISKKLFGKWILVPTKWNLSLTKAILSSAYHENRRQENGAYTFYITRKKTTC